MRKLQQKDSRATYTASRICAVAFDGESFDNETYGYMWGRMSDFSGPPVVVKAGTISEDELAQLRPGGVIPAFTEIEVIE